MLADYEEFLKVAKSLTGWGAFFPGHGNTAGGGSARRQLERPHDEGISLSVALLSPPSAQEEGMGDSLAHGTTHTGDGATNARGLFSLLDSIASASVVHPPIQDSQHEMDVVPAAASHSSPQRVSSRSAIGILVTDWKDIVLAGQFDYESLRGAEGATGVPWATHLSALFQSVRRGDLVLSIPGGGGVALGPASIGSSGVHQGGSLRPWSCPPTARGTLTVMSQRPLPIRWSATLVPVLNREAAQSMIGSLGRTLMRQHGLLVAQNEKEIREKVEAEAALAQIYSTGQIPEAGHKAKPDAAALKKKPQSLLNPGQKLIGMKRGRGVKIG
jgi:hypothetical protein